MGSSKYLQAESVQPRELNVPISARIREGLAEDLKHLSKIGGDNVFSNFLEDVLEKYVAHEKKRLAKLGLWKR